MSPWGFAAGWLVVAGTTFLTFGTAAQAWASLAEFKSLRQTVSDTAVNALSVTISIGMLAGGIGPDMPSWWDRYIPRWLALVPEILIGLARLAWLAFFGFRTTITQLRASGGEEAVDLARFLRLTEVWTIIMIGSALVLAAAVIQLVLAYQ